MKYMMLGSIDRKKPNITPDRCLSETLMRYLPSRVTGIRKGMKTKKNGLSVIAIPISRPTKMSLVNEYFEVF